MIVLTPANSQFMQLAALACHAGCLLCGWSGDLFAFDIFWPKVFSFSFYS